ncbi:hypothetical protein F4779DRAFT_604030 [Xylariaceae sp. FL0662B]|nr:hypothetical protein F4779DRAFT_604030 [Xylariaceae sp. FL0662B]
MSSVLGAVEGDESEVGTESTHAVRDYYTSPRPRSPQHIVRPTGGRRSRPSAPAIVHYPWQPPQPPPVDTSRRYRAPMMSGIMRRDTAGTFNPFDERQQERKKKGKEVVQYGTQFGPQNTFAPYPGYAYGYFPHYQYPPYYPVEAVNEINHPHESKEADGAAAINQLQELWSKKNIDGIFGSNSGDLTVHLDLDIQDDLEELTDELSRLCRLGHFNTAKQFFAANLQQHLDKPYVLIQYADVLLQQGDYKAVTQIGDAAIQTLEREIPDSKEIQLLRLNWELMQIFARSHTLDNIRGAPAIIFEDSIETLRELANAEDRSIGSTEINILGLVIHLTNHPHLNGQWGKYRDNVIEVFPASRYRRLYASLLSQGRLWDLHDLVTLMPSIKEVEVLFKDLFDATLIAGIQALTSDWSNSVHGYDASTTLALLSILTYILLELPQSSGKLSENILKQALPLGLSIMEKDPANMKSRPYLRLLLAKSRFSETKSRHEIASLLSDLKSSPGITYHTDSRLLPIYIPAETENPGWKVQDSLAEFKDPARLILRNARDLGDYTTEMLTLQELIRLSINPVDEFERLCDLQKSSQGDSTGYAQSLASRYLVSNTDESREKLKTDISRLLSKIESTDYLNSDHEWLLNMLLYSLEGRPMTAISQAFERSDANYRHMDQDLLQTISRKIPPLQNWAQSQMDLAKTSKSDSPERHISSSRGNKSKVPRDAATTSKKKPEQAQKAEKGERGNTTGPGSQRPHHDTNNTTAGNLGHSEGMQPYYWSAPAPAPPPTEDPEMKRMKKELEEHQQKIDLESKIRKKLEASFKSQLEEMQREAKKRQEEGMKALEKTKRDMELVKVEARIAAFEAAQMERKAGEARREALAGAEAKARAERHAQELLEAERRVKLECKLREVEAVAVAEATAKARLEAAHKAKEEAEAMAQKKARGWAEWQKSLEAEAKLRAEIEMLKKLQTEERAKKEAEAVTKKDEEALKERALKEAEQKKTENAPIQFKDAVGRKYSVPFKLCSTWDVSSIPMQH